MREFTSEQRAVLGLAVESKLVNYAARPDEYRTIWSTDVDVAEELLAFAAMVPPPEPILNAARAYLDMARSGDAGQLLSTIDMEELSEALARFNPPPVPPTYDELAAALFNLAYPGGGGAVVAHNHAAAVLKRVPK